VTDPKYAAFTALDPFFDIVQQGLAGLVDGDHYFDTIADDAEFEFRYHFPGWPETVRGRIRRIRVRAYCRQSEMFFSRPIVRAVALTTVVATVNQSQ
jgi:ketosteroid isomerase-like protein